MDIERLPNKSRLVEKSSQQSHKKHDTDTRIESLSSQPGMNRPKSMIHNSSRNVRPHYDHPELDIISTVVIQPNSYNRARATSQLTKSPTPVTGIYKRAKNSRQPMRNPEQGGAEEDNSPNEAGKKKGKAQYQAGRQADKPPNGENTMSSLDTWSIYNVYYRSR